MAMLRVRTTITGVTGSPWLSTSYFLGAADAPTQGEATAASGKVGTFWGSVDNVMNDDIDWATEPDVAVVEETGEQTGSFVTTPSVGSGLASDSILPFATQALVRLFTGAFIGGRQLRGRLFIPGLTEAGSTDGVLSPGTSTTILNAANALASPTAPRLAVWSRVNATAVAVGTASVWAQFAVLRSRRD